MFAWNFMNHGFLQNACVDIDGVLCGDPKPEDTSSIELMRRFYENVELKVKPRYFVKYLVTGRQERDRDVTTAWLEKHGIDYGTLVMRENRDIDIGEMKRDFYKDSNCQIFIESSIHQSQQICTAGPVICVEDLQLYDYS